MTTTETLVHESDMAPSDRDLEDHRTNALQRLSRGMTPIRSGARTLAERVPGVVRATQVRTSEATSALQRLPDSTLRWLAAGSLGVAAGLQMAGAPRLIMAAGAVPALLMGAAIARRPSEEHPEGTAQRTAARAAPSTASPGAHL